MLYQFQMGAYFVFMYKGKIELCSTQCKMIFFYFTINSKPGRLKKKNANKKGHFSMLKHISLL